MHPNDYMRTLFYRNDGGVKKRIVMLMARRDQARSFAAYAECNQAETIPPACLRNAQTQ